MINKAYLLVIVLCGGCVLAACHKEGTGGKATITGHVQHHTTPIPSAIVYIKYGEKEFPGSDVSGYDDNTLASSGDGHYEFEELRKGDYYIYGVGYDSTISETVRGGIPVKIKKKTETVEINVPVTE